MIDLGRSNPEIVGASVILRRFRENDIGPDYVNWLNDPAVVRFSNQRFRHHDRASCHAYYSSFPGSPNLFVAIDDKMTGRLIGTMTAYAAPHHGTVDVGIMLGARSVWGKGYGREAWCLMIDWLLGAGEARKVTAGTLACNKPMLGLMAAASMTCEAIRRAQEIVEGELQDIHLFARFRDD